MTPAQPILGGFEQILLLVFVLMTLVGIAGGNPASVLTPFIELCTRMLVGLAGLLCAALSALFKALISLIPTIVKAVAGASQSAASRRSR